ncbi:hypothetical protein [Streptomyces sp. NPDC093707]|uniref:hypothetical protein n=1 Tax=Streptomyces sp. NPDC093707 TaxID=3154984 RepID=UPI00344EC675
MIDTFTLAEPPQGLHFGFSDIGTVELRQISGPEVGAPLGEFPEEPTDDRFARFLRPGGHDVLNVAGPPAATESLQNALAARAQYTRFGLPDAQRQLGTWFREHGDDRRESVEAVLTGLDGQGLRPLRDRKSPRAPKTKRASGAA